MTANVAGFLRETAHARPDATCVVAGDRRHTWAELDHEVDLIAAGFIQRGLHAGDRLAFLLGNTYEFVVAFYAAARAGLVSVPLNPGYTSAEVAVLIADSGAKVLLVQPSTQTVGEDAVAALPGCEVVSVVGSEWQRTRRSGDGVVLAEADTPADALALLLFTAGTSGRPKAAMLSHGALRSNIEMVLDLTSPPAVVADDIVLVVLPMFHVYGLNTVLGVAVAAGATCVLSDRFDPADTLALIARERVTTVGGAPAMYRAWCATPGLAEGMASVRLLTSGGAPLPAAVFQRFAELTGKEIFEGYGMTETAPVVATTLVTGSPKPGSVGRPLPGLQVRLVDEDGENVDEGDPGEVCVRGPSVFLGYWPDAVGGPDSEGWFRSGDVAYADDDGDLFLVDRRREVILVNGFNVYPREIELAIDTHPAVAEAAVVGVPDDVTGEAVTALVVARAGVALTVADIAEHCSTRLARFKQPTTIRIVDELPHSTTGKVAKGRLREVHQIVEESEGA